MSDSNTHDDEPSRDMALKLDPEFERNLRRSLVFTLRTEERLTYDEIATRIMIGEFVADEWFLQIPTMSRATAWRDYRFVLDSVMPDPEAIDRARAEELDKLDRLERGLVRDGGAFHGNTSAVNSFVQCMRHRARLQGLEIQRDDPSGPRELLPINDSDAEALLDFIVNGRNERAAQAETLDLEGEEITT